MKTTTKIGTAIALGLLVLGIGIVTGTDSATVGLEEEPVGQGTAPRDCVTVDPWDPYVGANPDDCT